MSTKVIKHEPTLMEVISAAVRDPSVEVSKMHDLFDLRVRILQREAEIEFKAALSRIQARMPRICKNGTISIPGRDGKAGHKTPYALYEDIDSGIRPLLEEEGFSVSFTAEPTPQGSIWKCLLSHRLGHQEVYSTPPLPADKTGSKNEIQAIMSSNKYARRYLLGNIFNIVTIGADDDARSVSYLNDEQINAVSDLLNLLGMPVRDVQRFLSFAEADSVNHIQQSKFDSCMTALKQKAKKEGKL